MVIVTTSSEAAADLGDSDVGDGPVSYAKLTEVGQGIAARHDDLSRTLGLGALRVAVVLVGIGVRLLRRAT